MNVHRNQTKSLEFTMIIVNMVPCKHNLATQLKKHCKPPNMQEKIKPSVFDPNSFILDCLNFHFSKYFELNNLFIQCR